MPTAATRRKKAALHAIATNPKCRAAALRALPKSQRKLLSTSYLKRYRSKSVTRKRARPRSKYLSLIHISEPTRPY